MKLCEKMFVFESGGDDALAKIRDRFRNGADALFVFRRKKKWAQKRAVDAVAESEFCVAHPFEQIFRESGHAQKRSLQNLVPLFGGIVRSYRRCRSAGHFVLSPLIRPRSRERLAADDWSRQRSWARP